MPSCLSPKILSAEKTFLNTLVTDPDNRTALQRLGLIALQRRDYPQAVEYLEAAYILDSAHRGIQKSLGYAYTWNGEVEKAVNLLKFFPEVRRELKIYIRWWGGKNHIDLALAAYAVLQELPKAGSTNQLP